MKVEAVLILEEIYTRFDFETSLKGSGNVSNTQFENGQTSCKYSGTKLKLSEK